MTAFLSHIFVNVAPRSPTKRIDVVVGLDARGFLLGPLIALRLGAAFVPVRKDGQLPGACVKASYSKEYGEVRAPVRLPVPLLTRAGAGRLRDAARRHQGRTERRGRR
jgi:adenine/guanine phosphoribosyltransferase-like PRPP-binding protein